MSEKLYAITAIFNPCSYKTRYKLYFEFSKRCEEWGIELYTIEAAFKDQNFVVTTSNNPKNIQVRTNHEIWLKENLLNIAISKLPSDAKYIAWIDADVLFTNPNIAKDTIEKLKTKSVVQMFTHAMDLDCNHTCIVDKNGIIKEPQDGTCYRFNKIGFDHLDTKEDLNAGIGHTGYAWAATRDALEMTNGLLDFAILGSADKYMVHGLTDKIEASTKPCFSKGYNDAIRDWAKKSLKLNKNIGYVDGLLLHYFHGSKKNRGYHDRWKILDKHKFDPNIDITKNSDGVIVYSGNKPELESDIRKYFESRKEDSTEI